MINNTLKNSWIALVFLFSGLQGMESNKKEKTYISEQDNSEHQINTCQNQQDNSEHQINTCQNQNQQYDDFEEEYNDDQYHNYMASYPLKQNPNAETSETEDSDVDVDQSYSELSEIEDSEISREDSYIDLKEFQADINFIAKQNKKNTGFFILLPILKKCYKRKKFLTRFPSKFNQAIEMFITILNRLIHPEDISDKKNLISSKYISDTKLFEILQSKYEEVKNYKKTQKVIKELKELDHDTLTQMLDFLEKKSTRRRNQRNVQDMKMRKFRHFLRYIIQFYSDEENNQELLPEENSQELLPEIFKKVNKGYIKILKPILKDLINNNKINNETIYPIMDSLSKYFNDQTRREEITALLEDVEREKLQFIYNQL